MACVLAAVLALILSYLALTEGFLSPPVNLSVELLDFQAYVRWMPGPGSPDGTRYYLEFTDIKNFLDKAWNQSADCTNITSTQCCLILNHRQHFSIFFVRVMAEWRDERSGWETTDHSFQPYSCSLLSPPHLTIYADHQSIAINLSHPVQSVLNVPLKFLVNLFQMNSDNAAPKHIAQNRTSRYSRFTKLPYGNYCISASAFYTTMSKPNHNTTKCVSVRQQQPGATVWTWVAICVGVFVLISAGVAVIATRCYFRHHIKISHVPKALLIKKGTGTVLAPKPEGPCIHPLSVTDSYNPGHEDMSDVTSDGYFGRLNVPNGSVEEPEAVQFADNMYEDLPRGLDLYTTALEMEEEDEYLPREEILRYGLTEKTMNLSSVLALDWVPGAKTAELENLLNLKLEEFEETSKTEEQVQSCSFSYHCEGEEPSDEETDFLDYLGSGYEPRPDPLQMLDFKRH